MLISHAPPVQLTYSRISQQREDLVSQWASSNLLEDMLHLRENDVCGDNAHNNGIMFSQMQKARFVVVSWDAN